MNVHRVVWGLLVLCSSVFGHSGHHHLHQRHQHGHHDSLKTRGDVAVSDAESLIKTTLTTLSDVNKARVEHPSFNKYELASDASLSLADPLDYSVNATKRRRDVGNSGEGNNGTGLAAPYTIPSELKDAARIVAESKPQRPTGDHAQVAAKIRAKYDHKLNDTNAPSPLDRPDGLLGTFGPDVEQKTLKRASGYWMVDMAQLGSAPYAPSGYKVSLFRC